MCSDSTQFAHINQPAALVAHVPLFFLGGYYDTATMGSTPIHRAAGGKLSSFPGPHVKRRWNTSARRRSVRYCPWSASSRHNRRRQQTSRDPNTLLPKLHLLNTRNGSMCACRPFTPIFLDEQARPPTMSRTMWTSEPGEHRRAGPRQPPSFRIR